MTSAGGFFHWSGAGARLIAGVVGAGLNRVGQGWGSQRASRAPLYFFFLLLRLRPCQVVKEGEKRSASVLICIFWGPIQTFFCCKFCEKTQEVGGATGGAETVRPRSECGKQEWHQKKKDHI